MKKKPVPMTLISIPRSLHKRIKAIAEKDGRTMRAYLDIVIKEKENERN